MIMRAQGKYIDTTPIECVFTRGEAYADKLTFVVNAINNDVDVSDCTFTMRTVIDDKMTETVLDKSVEGDEIHLTWHVPDSATAVAGMLHLEIIGSQDAQLIIKYKMRAVYVKEAIFGDNIPVPDVIEEKLAQMNELIEAAKSLYAVDPTLTVEGAAADAKATGVAIDNVQAAVNACSAAVEECANDIEECSTAIERLQGTEQEVTNARYSPISDYTFASLSQRLNADISTRASQDAFERTMAEANTRVSTLETSVENLGSRIESVSSDSSAGLSALYPTKAEVEEARKSSVSGTYSSLDARLEGDFAKSIEVISELAANKDSAQKQQYIDPLISEITDARTCAFVTNDDGTHVVVPNLNERVTQDLMRFATKAALQMTDNKVSYIEDRVEILEDVTNTLSSVTLCGGAGPHNSIYRGACLGTAVTDEQYAAISDGTFGDLHIGDYWTIDGVNYRIAAFDYYLNCGDTACTTHHAVIVPDTCLYNHVMNDTNITTGGYVGSKMYTEGLERATTFIKGAFNGHVLSHRIYLTNAVANGRPSAGAWCDSEVDLMCEEMVYGTSIFRPTSDGTNVPTNYRVEQSQLPLFAHEPSRICNRATWWLRDVITASYFARVSYAGYAARTDASASCGIRPAFCIC